MISQLQGIKKPVTPFMKSKQQPLRLAKAKQPQLLSPGTVPAFGDLLSAGSSLRLVAAVFSGPCSRGHKARVTCHVLP